MFHKAGPDVEKALDPVLVFIRGTTNLFQFVEPRYFEHFGRTSESATYAVWLSFIMFMVRIQVNTRRSPVHKMPTDC